MASQASRILIVGPAGLGAWVMAQPLLITLQKRYPGSDIDVLAADEHLPLLRCMPQISHIISLPEPLALGACYRLGLTLAERHYQRAYLLSDTLKSALIPYFANIPERTGWRGAMRYWLVNDIRLFSPRRYTHAMQRYMALAYEPGDPAGFADITTMPQPLITADAAKVGGESKRLVICADHVGNWSMTDYSTVASEAISRGWQLSLLSLGEAVEVDADVNVLLGIDNLAAMIEHMAAADAVVGSDQDLMPIAAAMGRPWLDTGATLALAGQRLHSTATKPHSIPSPTDVINALEPLNR